MSNGALFTSGSTKSFSTADSNTDGRELERTMHSVYLVVFDTINSSMIASNAGFIDGLAFGSAAYFPGLVDAPTDPNAVYEIQIDASVPLDWRRPNLYSELSARRPTGAYLAAGTIAEITVPQALVNSGYTIRVGTHNYDLTEKPLQLRLARVSNLFPITSTTTQVANPMGGSIYIEVPYLANAGLVSIEL